MDNLEPILFNNPHVTFVALSGLLSIFSLDLSPGMIPIIFTLATLLVYSRKLFPTFAQHTVRRTTALWVSLTLGGSIPRLSASIHALSKPGASIVSLIFLSGVTSLLGIAAIYLDARASRHFRLGSARLLLFPAIWATFWSTIAHLSPLGTLSTWSPVEGTKAYDWLVPLLGPESLNWVVAAWAVVISQTLMSWHMDPGSDDDDECFDGLLIPTEPILNGHTNEFTSSKKSQRSLERNQTMSLAALLVLLTVPSYMTPILPLPIENVSKVTPLTVGCALPTFDRYKHHQPTFNDFLKESVKMDGTTDFILWPEGAVRFDSEADRDKTLAEVSIKVKHAFVGVAFEEISEDPANPTGRAGIRRNGIAIVSNKSSTPHLLYYKQHLVPIVESFSLSHSHEPPTAFNATVKVFGQAPRHLAVTSSICLDFTAPSLFETLIVRPALILAPGRTWDISIGYTMWKQAAQRAHEVGSNILWCDGGAGGVSGVAGRGYNEVVQVGLGSWTRIIGIDYPFKDRRTLYARYGDSALLLFWALVVGPPVWYRGRSFVVERFRRRSLTSGPPVGNLLDN